MNTGVARTEYEAELVAEEFKEGLVRAKNVMTEEDRKFYQERGKQKPVMAKKAGSYSASVPDYQGEQYYNEQHMNDTDQEPYVNHDQRDYPYGMHDSPENTDAEIGWPKDETSYVVRTDILEKPFDRMFPAGLPSYEVTIFPFTYPQSDGAEV